MKYGLEEDEMQLLLSIFSETEHLQQAILYGSRAKGNNKPFSDVDITLLGEGLTDEDLTDVIFKLSESSLPYFCDVSLFSHISNPALVSHIKRRGVNIYQKQN